MTVEVLLFVLVVGLAAALGRLYGPRRSDEPDAETRRGGISELEGRTVVVHTRDDQSLRGVMVREYEDCIALEGAVYLRQGELERDEREVSLEGRSVIPSANVAHFQDLTGAR